MDDMTQEEFLASLIAKETDADYEPRARNDEEYKLDGILIKWREKWAKENHCYTDENRHLMPPPIYDADVAEWKDGFEKSAHFTITKEIAEKYNAELVIEFIQKHEELRKRHEETMKKYEEWKASDEFKQMKKDAEW